MLRLTRLIAEADAACLTSYRRAFLLADRVDPPFAEIRPGQHLAVHPSCAGSAGPIELLLSGHLRWSSTVPPPGYAHAALVALPCRDRSRLILISNRSQARPLSERRVELAASFSAHAGLCAALGVRDCPRGSPRQDPRVASEALLAAGLLLRRAATAAPAHRGAIEAAIDSVGEALRDVQGDAPGPAGTAADGGRRPTVVPFPATTTSPRAPGESPEAG